MLLFIYLFITDIFRVTTQCCLGGGESNPKPALWLAAVLLITSSYHFTYVRYTVVDQGIIIGHFPVLIFIVMHCTMKLYQETA